jgi:DNA-binding GntR family transcriptional regulator
VATTPERAKYLQIADDLRRKILDHTYPVGSALPSTSQLMSTYGVSITVARAAVRELQNEGLAVGQPGKAVFVQHEPKPAEPSAEYVELTQQITALREALENAAESLDARLTDLELAVGLRAAKTDRSGGRGRTRKADQGR